MKEELILAEGWEAVLRLASPSLWERAGECTQARSAAIRWPGIWVGGWLVYRASELETTEEDSCRHWDPQVAGTLAAPNSAQMKDAPRRQSVVEASECCT